MCWPRSSATRWHVQNDALFGTPETRGGCRATRCPGGSRRPRFLGIPPWRGPVQVPVHLLRVRDHVGDLILEEVGPEIVERTDLEARVDDGGGVPE